MNRDDNEAWEEFHRWPIPKPSKVHRIHYRTLSQITIGAAIGAGIVLLVGAILARLP